MNKINSQILYILSRCLNYCFTPYRSLHPQNSKEPTLEDNKEWLGFMCSSIYCGIRHSLVYRAFVLFTYLWVAGFPVRSVLISCQGWGCTGLPGLSVFYSVVNWKRRV